MSPSILFRVDKRIQWCQICCCQILLQKSVETGREARFRYLAVDAVASRRLKTNSAEREPKPRVCLRRRPYTTGPPSTLDEGGRIRRRCRRKARRPLSMRRNCCRTRAPAWSLQTRDLLLSAHGRGRAQVHADLVQTGKIGVYGVSKACEFLQILGFLWPLNGNSNDFQKRRSYFFNCCRSAGRGWCLERNQADSGPGSFAATATANARGASACTSGSFTGAFCHSGYARRCGTATGDGVRSCQFAASGDNRQFRRLGDALPPHRQHAW